jgi:hypothetical protein
MRIDLYTKFILTIIAVCLVVLSVRSLQDPSRVAAQPPLEALRVTIAGFDMSSLGSGVPVNIIGIGDQAALPVTLSGGGPDGNTAVPVSVVNPVVPVSVSGAGQDGRAPVAVNVVQVSSRPLGNAGVPITPNTILPVNMVQVAGEAIAKGGGAFPTAPRTK